MTPIQVTLKPTYEVPMSGTIAANAQGGVASAKITKPFRINGVIITFGDDHINNVRHFLLTAENDNISTTSRSTGRNLVPPEAPTPYYIGHSVLRKIKAIREFSEGNRYLKVHIVNNNAYQITYNVAFIIEEI